MAARAPLAALLVLVALLAMPSWALVATPMPAGTQERGPLGTPDDPVAPLERMMPRTPGTVVDATFLYGPFHIPAGWDLTRASVDLPFLSGFVTRLAYRVEDPATGEQPTNMELHIHHGLWFRGSGHAQGEFLFGTGEERTLLDLDARSEAAPGGPRYGIAVMAGEPHALILMLHNKLTQGRTVNILVDVTFVFGTAQQIALAQGCGDPGLVGRLSPPAGCLAGEEFRGLTGYLWGDFFNVPREPQGDGVFTYPLEGTSVAPQYPEPPPWFPVELPDAQPPGTFFLETVMAMERAGTLVHAVGHVHPGGLETVVANLGPEGSACEADLDGDGLPGVTLMRSRKINRNDAGGPASEDFQMGVTQPGWRAPLRPGDRLAQFGVYANRDFASYQAMTFTAAHVDHAEVPPPRRAECGLEDTRPILPGGQGDASATVPNRPWDGPELPLCGGAAGAPCDDPGLDPPFTGPTIQRVVIAGFTYVPGDQNVAGSLGYPPRVSEGQSLPFLNADGGAVVRHTVTSCVWPCNGPYRANYPVPDGRFDSDRMSNLDPTDGGSFPPDPEDDSFWRTPRDLEEGYYSYYCRLHPAMRGWFKVV